MLSPAALVRHLVPDPAPEFVPMLHLLDSATLTRREAREVFRAFRQGFAEHLTAAGVPTNELRAVRCGLASAQALHAFEHKPDPVTGSRAAAIDEAERLMAGIGELVREAETEEATV